MTKDLEDEIVWTRLVSLETQLPTKHSIVNIFERVLQVWCESPEYFTKSILRAEIVGETPVGHYRNLLDADWQIQKTVRRRLIPRIHREKNTTVQDVLIGYQQKEEIERRRLVTVLVSSSATSLSEQWPFFYPKTRYYAFEFHFKPNGQVSTFADAASFDPNEESVEHMKHAFEFLLLRFLKFMRGDSVSENGFYQKRVYHDQLVEKELFQDKYAELKDKYKYWVSIWGHEAKETSSHNHSNQHQCAKMNTDPKKHVFEEIAIAAFLICIWEQRKKPVRFVDLGCGNGFLVYLLAKEGYHGYGIDVDARHIWTVYDGKPILIQEKLDMPSLIFDVRTGRPVNSSWDDQIPHSEASTIVEEGFDENDLWLLGNHADELTPWIPIVAAKSNIHATRQACTTPKFACLYFILPCCFHDLAGDRNPFGRTIPQSHDQMCHGRYGYYLRWIEYLGQDVCGFETEREWLRIPSTKNIAIISQEWIKSIDQMEELEQNITNLVAGVQYKARLSHIDRKLLKQRCQTSLRSRTASEDQDIVQDLADAFGSIDVLEDI